jgi:hypothetical protein
MWPLHNLVNLHVFTFLVPCCDVRYDFCIKMMFIWSLLSHVGSSWFINVICMYLCILFSNTISMSDYVRVGFSAVPSSSICSFLYFVIITIFPFFIEMLQYDWLWSGHMIIKEMFEIVLENNIHKYIQITLINHEHPTCESKDQMNIILMQKS